MHRIESQSADAAVTNLDREAVCTLALAAGFSEAGLIALPHARQQRDADRFSAWLKAGRAGKMHYLERLGEDGRLLRSEVSVPFPWARSAVVCFSNYNSAQPLSTHPADQAAGWIARYAWSSREDVRPKTGNKDSPQVRKPSDYHKILKKRLLALEESLHAQFGAFEARGYVDTGPVVERSLATEDRSS